MTTKKITWALLTMTLTFACGVVACDGGTETQPPTGSGGGGGMSEYALYCQADYDRDVKCGNMPLPTQVADCLKNEPCDQAFFRDGVLEGLHKCIVERDCMTSDDTCIAQADAMLPETASSMAYGPACMAKFMECQVAGTPFGDDSCFNYKLVKDTLLDQMMPCFQNACDMVTTCIFGVIDDVYMTCPGK